MNDEYRYIFRYYDVNRKKQLKVIWAEDIYKARDAAISEIGGVQNLIACHRLYNPKYDNNRIYD